MQIGKCILIGLLSAPLYAQCNNAGLLRSKGHMDLGVRLSGNSAFVAAETSALDYYASILDMTWHQDNTDNCSIEFRPVSSIRSASGDVVAIAYQPRLKYFDGIVYFHYSNGYDKAEVFEHELGHLFGLEHNREGDSVMAAHDPSGKLDGLDIQALRRLHSIRDRS